MKFTIGDKVKCLQDNNAELGGPKKGEILQINNINTDYCGNQNLGFDLTDRYKWRVDRRYATGELCNWPSNIFVLVDDVNELIEVANKGIKALYELRKNHTKKIQYRYDSKEWQEYNTNDPKPHEIRLKPIYEFKSFKINNHSVICDGTTLGIGCQMFEAKIVKNILSHFVRHNWSMPWKLKDDAVRGCRNGLSWMGIEISWTDAEKLLTELENIGV